MPGAALTWVAGVGGDTGRMDIDREQDDATIEWAAVRRARMVVVGFGVTASCLLLVLLGSVVAFLDESESAGLHAGLAAAAGAGVVAAVWACGRAVRLLRRHGRQLARERHEFAMVDRAVDVALAAVPGVARERAVAALCELPTAVVVDELVLRVRDVLIDEDSAAVVAASRLPIPATMGALVSASADASVAELRALLPDGPVGEVIKALVEVALAVEDGRDRLR